jgi:hypothetical protein
MNRYAKTYSQPAKPDLVGPHSNKFTVDLMGVPLTDQDLEHVRSAAVKAAMLAAAGLLKQDASAFDAFGTFSTFSTFGSGAAGTKPELDIPHDLSPGATRAIEETLGGRARRKSNQ